MFQKCIRPAVLVWLSYVCSAVVSYIYFTRIVVYLMRSTLPYNLVWIASAAEETGALIFYILVGWKFRPQNDNPYFKLAQEEEIQLQEV